MGTAPNNFPPDASLNIDQQLTGTKLNQTAGFTTTTFFTAPNPGVYQVSALLRVLSTDAAGSLAMTVGTPHAGNLTATQEPDLTVPKDGFLSPAAIWMNAGDVVSVAVVATMLGVTSYNVYLTARRLF